jgi:hypothetical protein
MVSLAFFWMEDWSKQKHEMGEMSPEAICWFRQAADKGSKQAEDFLRGLGVARHQ